MLILLFLSSLTALISACQAQQLRLVNDWAKGPTEAAMYIREPGSPAMNPAIVVLVQLSLSRFKNRRH
jgi:hypothetical protein